MIKRKISSQSGFSLAETLLTVLILLMVSVVVANGVPSAMRAYENVVIGANARILLSTTISALRDELATATNVKLDNITNTAMTYYSADIGATSKIYLNEAAVGDDPVAPIIMLQEYIDTNPSDFGAESTSMHNINVRPLVSVKAATDDLYVTYDSISYPTNEFITVNGLKVKRKSSDTIFATADLTIRFLIPTKAETL